MNELLIGIISFLVGGFLAYLYFSKKNKQLMESNRNLEEDLSRAKFQLESEQKISLEKDRLYKKSEEELADSFRLISSKLLRENQESFLSLAKSELEKQKIEGSSSLEKKEEAIKNMVDPMKVILGEVRGRMETIEKDYQKTFTEVKEQFKYLKEDQTKLQVETANLVKALRAPQIRGQWGEIQLKRVVELAGMIKFVDFVEQASTDTETGKLRPDMLVHLPGKKTIVIDAKTPLVAYLEMIEAKTEDERKRYLAEHGRQIKEHINKLSAKAYWDQFSESPEFVVLFLPNEALYAAALEAEPQLIELGTVKNVIIATPTTLITLLKAIAYGWNQETLAENARKISVLGKELFDRMSVFVNHMEALKRGLEKSVEAYNKAVGTFESRVLPSTRRFKELGISTDKEISELEDIEIIPKDIRDFE